MWILFSSNIDFKMSNTICFISTHHVDENFTWTRTPSKQVSWRLFTLHKHHFEYLVKHFPLHAQALWVGNWVNVVGPYFRSWHQPRALKTRSVISRTLLYTRRVSLSRPCFGRDLQKCSTTYHSKRQRECILHDSMCITNRWEHGV
jgi:hypothetical protein